MAMLSKDTERQIESCVTFHVSLYLSEFMFVNVDYEFHTELDLFKERVVNML